eukprot:6604683-Ditylum_brightwellii.AAC.2
MTLRCTSAIVSKVQAARDSALALCPPPVAEERKRILRPVLVVVSGIQMSSLSASNELIDITDEGAGKGDMQQITMENI